MKIVVCVKQVPDIEGRIIVEKGVISLRELVPSYVISSLDLVAIEEAIRIREEVGRGEVTLVSLGEATAEDALRKGLAMGADDAVLLCDAVFEQGDSYSTALVLARAIETIPHDLVLGGPRADDTEAGVVGSYLAEMLGVPMVMGVVGVDMKAEENKMTVRRKLARGDREVVECPLPALLAVEAGLNRPRNPTIRGIMRARSREITRRGAKQLGLSP